MTYYYGQLIAIANMSPIRKVILGPYSVQYSLTIIQRSRRAHLCPGNDIEDDGPLLIRSCLTANDENGELLFTRAQSGEDRKGFIDVLLCSHGLVDQGFKILVQKQQDSELVYLRYQRRIIRNMILMILDFSYR